MARVLGIDPGLRRTGWGVIETVGNRLCHIDHGVVDTDAGASVPERLCALHEGLAEIVARHAPDEAAVEETFVNRNPESTLKLGLARGVALLAPALAGSARPRVRREPDQEGAGRCRTRRQGAGRPDGPPSAARRGRCVCRCHGCARRRHLSRPHGGHPDTLGAGPRAGSGKGRPMIAKLRGVLDSVGRRLGGRRRGRSRLPDLLLRRHACLDARTGVRT